MDKKHLGYIKEILLGYYNFDDEQANQIIDNISNEDNIQNIDNDNVIDIKDINDNNVIDIKDINDNFEYNKTNQLSTTDEEFDYTLLKIIVFLIFV